jgi:serine phosphatase RsbU (regulator of sigma subunit)
MTEAWHSHPSKEDYGINRLTAAISNAPQTADELFANLEADFKDFTGGAPLEDDVTFLVITKD